VILGELWARGDESRELPGSEMGKIERQVHYTQDSIANWLTPVK
jgi:hypothetical protein